MSKYIGSTLVAGVGRNTVRNAHTLLDFKWSDHIINSMEWLRADTFSWQPGSVYLAVYNHLVADVTGKTLQSETVGGITVQFYLASDGHKICPSGQESNVAKIYSATGVAWYYILDTTNTRFKLPRTKFGFTGVRDTVGKYVEAGLPNITGDFCPWAYKGDGQDNGAFYSAGTTENAYNSSGTNWGRRIFFNASRSSSIYGNSTTVQSPATQMYLYFYVGQYSQSATEQTAGLNAELFNVKVDKGHQVIEFQEPTASNNYTWYRKYADGWVEQGGKLSGTSVTFPVEFLYEPTIATSVLVSETASAVYNNCISGITTTGFQGLRHGSNKDWYGTSDFNGAWYACGLSAE